MVCLQMPVHRRNRPEPREREGRPLAMALRSRSMVSAQDWLLDRVRKSPSFYRLPWLGGHESAVVVNCNVVGR